MSRGTNHQTVPSKARLKIYENALIEAIKRLEDMYQSNNPENYSKTAKTPAKK